MTTTVTEDAIVAMGERFKRDSTNHKMAVCRDDGLYRHLRFRVPGSSFYWFDLVTWPGTLVVNGDCGTFVFSRLADMFEFFRGAREINPSYWGEKTPGGTRSVREYSEDRFKALLTPALDEYEQEFPDRSAAYRIAQATYDAASSTERLKLSRPVKPMTPAEARERVTDFEADGLLSHEQGALDLLRELGAEGVVSETWEWDLSDWEWSFLWSCYAIVWGIEQHDISRPVPVLNPEETPND